MTNALNIAAQIVFKNLVLHQLIRQIALTELKTAITDADKTPDNVVLLVLTKWLLNHKIQALFIRHVLMVAVLTRFKSVGNVIPVIIKKIMNVKKTVSAILVLDMVYHLARVAILVTNAPKPQLTVQQPELITKSVVVRADNLTWIIIGAAVP